MPVGSAVAMERAGGEYAKAYTRAQGRSPWRIEDCRYPSRSAASRSSSDTVATADALSLTAKGRISSRSCTSEPQL